MNEKVHVFVSGFFYALAKMAAHQGFDTQVVLADEMDRETWGGFRSIRRFQDSIRASGAKSELFVDSTTTIAKARARAAYAFAQSSTADLWVSVDDDAELDEATAHALMLASLDVEARIVMVPQMVADGSRVNVAFATMPPEVTRTVDGKRLARAQFVGCSIMCVNRRAIEILEARYPELRCEEQKLLALFLEEVRDHLWLGEDVAFCERANRAGVQVEVLLDVPSVHAGHALAASWAEPFLARGPTG